MLFYMPNMPEYMNHDHVMDKAKVQLVLCCFSDDMHKTSNKYKHIVFSLMRFLLIFLLQQYVRKTKQELLLLVVVDQTRDEETREKTHPIVPTSLIIMYHQKEKSQKRNDSISSPPLQNKYRQNMALIHHNTIAPFIIIYDIDVTKHFTSLYTDSYPATQLVSL